jgi:hypothetical protein
LKTAEKHVDRNILGRRRAMFPDEEAKLVNIRQVAPDLVDAELVKEDTRIREKYPERLHVSDAFDTPNRILEQRVTPDPEHAEQE